jgi:predicted GTPase
MSLDKQKLHDLSPAELRAIRDRIRATKINVLMVGGTGVGKSSTISALFQSHGLDSKAAIGQGTKPETLDVSSHEMENLIIWDTPGLGDSPANDKIHQEKIVELLNRVDDKGQPLIDLVFLTLDASSRDFSSAFTLIKNIIQPNLRNETRDRLLIGLNQADQAMKGHYWDKAENKPEDKLIARPDELTQTVKDRIKADTGMDVEPIYYSAGCTLDGEVLSQPYNLQKLLSFIMERLPRKKRAAIAEHINPNEENFRSNDDKEDYQEKVEESVLDSLMSWAREVAVEVGGALKTMATDPDNLKAAVLTLIPLVIGLFKKK